MDLPAQVVPLVRRARREPQVLLVQLGQLGQLAQLAFYQDLLVQLVLQALLVLEVPLELQGQQDHKVLPDQLDQSGLQGQQDYQVKCQDPQVLRAQQGPQVQLEHRGYVVLRV